MKQAPPPPPFRNPRLPGVLRWWFVRVRAAGRGEGGGGGRGHLPPVQRPEDDAAVTTGLPRCSAAALLAWRRAAATLDEKGAAGGPRRTLSYQHKMLFDEHARRHPRPFRPGPFIRSPRCAF
eukprot:gene14633-biopygen3185